MVSSQVLMLAIVHSQWFRIERVQQDLWLERRLKPVETGHDPDLCCMEGTRKSLLDQIGAWVTNKPQNDVLQGNIFWIYGSPGIGKTALAHSICASLDAQEQLAGAFFCRRDDPNLSDARNILPTLLYKLARRIPLFGALWKNVSITTQT